MLSFVSFSLPAASSVLYEKRIGCLNVPPPRDTTRLIEAAKTMLNDTVSLMIMNQNIASKLKLPIWKRYTADWDTIFDTGLC